jgi:uncharacterized Zn-finger protein
MADKIVPHFQNDAGVLVVRVNAHEFMCEGASPPYDHPHVYLDMGDADELVCPYCSTLYRLDRSLKPGACEPRACAVAERTAA